MNQLSPAERRALRARAHSLNPVVIIGNDGLTPGVNTEVERSLKAHELIKIKVGGMEHAERESTCETICGQTGAVQVQHIGKILVIYRKRPLEENRPAFRKPRKKASSGIPRAGKSSVSPAASNRKSSGSRAGGAQRPRTQRG